MRPLTGLATLLFATATLACGDKNNNVVTPIASIAGTWNLQTVNGQPLPITLDQNGADKAELTAISVTLVPSSSSGGSFTLRNTVRLTQSGQVTTQSDSVSGTYSLNGSALALVANGETVTGSWTGGNTLTLSQGGSVFLFARQ